MKKIFLILIAIGFLVVYLPEKFQQAEDEHKKEAALAEKKTVFDYYENYPKAVIPYQISGTNYVLETKLLSTKISILGRAFQVSHDDYNIDGYKDGMTVHVRFSLKNPYERDIWVPIPSNIEITSNEYPLETNRRTNSMHPHEDYLSDEIIFTDKEPPYKRDQSNNELYYIPSNDSIIAQADFKLLPIAQKIIICGLSVYRNDTRYEKGIIIDLKQNKIVGQEVFQDHYYYWQ